MLSDSDSGDPYAHRRPASEAPQTPPAAHFTASLQLQPQQPISTGQQQQHRPRSALKGQSASPPLQSRAQISFADGHELAQPYEPAYAASTSAAAGASSNAAAASADSSSPHPHDLPRAASHSAYLSHDEDGDGEDDDDGDEGWESQLHSELALSALPPSHCLMVDVTAGFQLREEFKRRHDASQVQFVYALQMKSFQIGMDDSPEAEASVQPQHLAAWRKRALAKRNFLLVFKHLRQVLGGKINPKTGLAPYGDGCSYLGYMPLGKWDPTHSYIQVGASLEQLESLAEHIKLQMPGLSDDFHDFSSDLKPLRTRFAHPQGRACPAVLDAFFRFRKAQSPMLPGDCPTEAEVDREVRENRLLPPDPQKLAQRKQEYRDRFLRDRIEAWLASGMPHSFILNQTTPEGRKLPPTSPSSAAAGSGGSGAAGAKTGRKVTPLTKVKVEAVPASVPAANAEPSKPATLLRAKSAKDQALLSLSLSESGAAAGADCCTEIKQKDGTVLRIPYPPGFSLPPCTCNLFVPYQREELVRRLIERALDNVLAELDSEKPTAGNGLRELKRRKVIKDIFPLHYEVPPEFYRLSRSELVATYCSYKKFSSWSAALSFTRASQMFIGWMRDYFGEKIGMYFAFLHFYNSSTMILAILGLAPALWSYIEEPDNPLVVVYCVVIMMWAALFVKFWNRRSNDCASDWNMLEYEAKEGEMDSFLRSLRGAEGTGAANFGFYEVEGRWVDMTDFAVAAKNGGNEALLKFIPKNHIDTSGKLPHSWLAWFGPRTREGNAERAQLNASLWRYMKEALGGTLITTLIGGVLASIVSLLILKLVLTKVLSLGGQLLAGVANGLTIFALDFLYKRGAIAMTEWENHRTITQFEEKLTAKCFVFQFVNSYFSLFYIAFFKSGFRDRDLLPGFKDECKDANGELASNCMQELSSALMTIIGTRLAIAFITQRLLPKYLTKLTLARLKLKADVWAKMQQGADGLMGFASDVGKGAVNLAGDGLKGIGNAVGARKDPPRDGAVAAAAGGVAAAGAAGKKRHKHRHHGGATVKVNLTDSVFGPNDVITPRGRVGQHSATAAIAQQQQQPQQPQQQQQPPPVERERSISTPRPDAAAAAAEAERAEQSRRDKRRAEDARVAAAAEADDPESGSRGLGGAGADSTLGASKPASREASRNEAPPPAAAQRSPSPPAPAPTVSADLAAPSPAAADSESDFPVQHAAAEEEKEPAPVAPAASAAASPVAFGDADAAAVSVDAPLPPPADPDADVGRLLLKQQERKREREQQKEQAERDAAEAARVAAAAAASSSSPPPLAAASSKPAAATASEPAAAKPPAPKPAAAPASPATKPTAAPAPAAPAPTAASVVVTAAVPAPVAEEDPYAIPDLSTRLDLSARAPAVAAPKPPAAPAAPASKPAAAAAEEDFDIPELDDFAISDLSTHRSVVVAAELPTGRRRAAAAPMFSDEDQAAGEATARSSNTLPTLPPPPPRPPAIASPSEHGDEEVSQKHDSAERPEEEVEAAEAAEEVGGENGPLPEAAPADEVDEAYEEEEDDLAPAAAAGQHDGALADAPGAAPHHAGVSSGKNKGQQALSTVSDGLTGGVTAVAGGVTAIAGGALFVGDKLLGFGGDVWAGLSILPDMDKLSLEYQAIQPKYAINRNVLGTFDDYNELVIGYGYMVMFAAAFPICPAVTLLHNVIQHTTHGFKVLKNFQKAKYFGATDIGMFWYLMLFLTIMSVGTNTAIICYTSSQLDRYITNPSAASRLGVALVLEHIFGLCVFLVLSNLSDFRPSLRVRLAYNAQVKEVENEYAEYVANKKMKALEAEKKGEGGKALQEAVATLVQRSNTTVLRKGTMARQQLGNDAAPPASSSSLAGFFIDSAESPRGGVSRAPTAAPKRTLSVVRPPAAESDTLSPGSWMPRDPQERKLYEAFKAAQAERQQLERSVKAAAEKEAADESDDDAAAPLERKPSSSLVRVAPAPSNQQRASSAFGTPEPPAPEVHGIGAGSEAGNLRRVALFDASTRSLRHAYTQSPSNLDVLFPFTVPAISTLDGLALSGQIVLGSHTYRLVVGKASGSESLEVTLRYIAGPLPHFCTAYLVVLQALDADRVGLYRSLSFLFQSYTGFGFAHFASLSELRQEACYDPLDADEVTFGVVFPSNDWAPGEGPQNAASASSSIPRSNVGAQQPSFPTLLSREQPQPAVPDRAGGHRYPPEALDDDDDAADDDERASAAQQVLARRGLSKAAKMKMALPPLNQGLRTPMVSTPMHAAGGAYPRAMAQPRFAQAPLPPLPQHQHQHHAAYRAPPESSRSFASEARSPTWSSRGTDPNAVRLDVHSPSHQMHSQQAHHQQQRGFGSSHPYQPPSAFQPTHRPAPSGGRRVHDAYYSQSPDAAASSCFYPPSMQQQPYPAPYFAGAPSSFPSSSNAAHSQPPLRPGLSRPTYGMPLEVPDFLAPPPHPSQQQRSRYAGAEFEVAPTPQHYAHHDPALNEIRPRQQPQQPPHASYPPPQPRYW